MKGLGFYGTDTVEIKQDVDLYKENITRILLTEPGERVLSSFGSKFKGFLFQLNYIMQEEINSEIARAIAQWEPRITVKSMRTSRPDPNTFHINLILEIKETLEEFGYDQLITL